MKNIYLYGASDDCCEVETDFGKNFESYGDISINGIVARYEFDGDWGIELVGDIPDSWVVKTISANAPTGYRWRDDAGQFIHIQVPDDETVEFGEVA